MMERTDREFLALLRQITRHTLLYTEMVTTHALLSNPKHRYRVPLEDGAGPVSMQLGGDDPASLAWAAKLAEDLGYSEVNLNVGCPSARVQKGRIGAVLMLDPQRVAECVQAMRRAVDLPITVKHRLGVDDHDQFEKLESFVRIVASAGAARMTIHARKAWLSGLSPKENRSIPPLRYDWVYRIAAQHPGLCIEINGGIPDLEQSLVHLQKVSAVMIGRAVWNNPFILAQADRRLFAQAGPLPTRKDVVMSQLPRLQARADQGSPWAFVLRPLLNLYSGQAGGRRWRRFLSEGANTRRHASLTQLVQAALRHLQAEPSTEPSDQGCS